MQAPDTLTSLRWDPVLARVEVIDQTLLPHRLQWQPLETLQCFCHAISSMQVRGAPLIGITAAFGLALELARDASDQNLEAAVAALLQTRPTAVNLGWALQQVQQAVVNLLERGVLTRFGPLYNIEKADGAFSLCALKVPAEHFDEITEQVNRYDEVAHNYQREHEWNMWFVLATENQQKLLKVFEEIMRVTQCPGLNLPKQTEFFVGLKLEA